LCEAAAESYLPILNILEHFQDNGKGPHLTLDFSPILCEQLASQEFKSEFKIYLDQRMSAAEHDLLQFTADRQSALTRTASFWIDFYRQTSEQFSRLNEDIVGAFRKLQEAGVVEILTCGATHGYFPLLSRDATIRAQVEEAKANYRKFFGRPPEGIWLPECGYRPSGSWHPPSSLGRTHEPYRRKGVDDILAESDLSFFIAAGVDRRAGGSSALPFRTSNRPAFPSYTARTAGAGFDSSSGVSPRDLFQLNSSEHEPVKFFVRDPETGFIVWSGEYGYPGDGNYLEFHKRRFPSGHRYWAVTSPKSDLGLKTEYFRDRALEKTEEHARHFVNTVIQALRTHQSSTHRDGIVVSPFDAELFGHWWFEGPEFLAHVLRLIDESKEVEMTSLSSFISQHRSAQAASLEEGSWGMGGGHYVWFNDQTAWTWPIIYAAEEKMHRLARLWQEQTDHRAPLVEEAIKQTARELMLMVASDWQFLITTNSARDYAEKRFNGHARSFARLADLSERLLKEEEPEAADRKLLADSCSQDNVFEEIQIDWFA
jgi:1,4-alpha-glucan branching enzyme